VAAGAAVWVGVVVVGAGAVGVGAGFGGVDSGFDSGAGVTGLEINPDGAEMNCGATECRTRWCAATGRCREVTRLGGMRTTGGAGAGSMIRGFAARGTPGEVDSKAARQRYPEVTPAATSAQSRSASNEIRTRISIGPMDDSIGGDPEVR
jgi:hypothetical protein